MTLMQPIDPDMLSTWHPPLHACNSPLELPGKITNGESLSSEKNQYVAVRLLYIQHVTSKDIKNNPQTPKTLVCKPHHTCSGYHEGIMLQARQTKTVPHHPPIGFACLQLAVCLCIYMTKVLSLPTLHTCKAMWSKHTQMQLAVCLCIYITKDLTCIQEMNNMYSNCNQLYTCAATQQRSHSFLHVKLKQNVQHTI